MTQNLNLTIKEKEERKFAFDSQDNVAMRTLESGGLNIPPYDFIDFSDESSIKFYKDGATGTLVATLNITSSSVEKI